MKASDDIGTFLSQYLRPYSFLLHLPSLRSTVSEDAAIEPRTVATFTSTVRGYILVRSNNVERVLQRKDR
jgi:hypothetical protein